MQPLYRLAREMLHQRLTLVWALVFLIALVGTSAELVAGDVCPKSSSGMPLCFFSLAFCAFILVLYLADKKLERPPGAEA